MKHFIHYAPAVKHTMLNVWSEETVLAACGAYVPRIPTQVTWRVASITCPNCRASH